MNILIVEDTPMMGKAIEEVLIAQGHQVSWVLGASSLEPLVFIQPDKSESSLDLSSFDLAFCDGQLLGNFSGPQITEVLSAAGICTVGISTEMELNQSMTEKGACAGFNKGLFFLGLFGKAIEPRAVLSQPHTVQGLEASLKALAQNSALRKAADQVIMKYLND
ncbi:MAG: hypothetical protein K2X27_05675 [Candidatus Obscuribacterales bacterium]|nr:hypothetical protein [Candidatus Obscuribacterales bacterium]